MADGDFGPIMTPLYDVLTAPCTVCGHPRWQVHRGLFGRNGEGMLICTNCSWRQDVTEGKAKWEFKT